MLGAGGGLSVDMSQGTCPRLAVTVWICMQWMSADPHPGTPTRGRDKGERGGGRPRGTNAPLLFASLL